MYVLLAAVCAHAQDAQEQAGSPPAPPQPQQAAQAGDVQESETPRKKGKKKEGGSTHPTVTIGDHVTLQFTARIESDVRLATPDIGLDSSRFDWEDRRVG